MGKACCTDSTSFNSSSSFKTFKELINEKMFKNVKLREHGDEDYKVRSSTPNLVAMRGPLPFMISLSRTIPNILNT